MIQAQGGLLYLNESVEIDAALILYNPETEEEQECRVNYLGKCQSKASASAWNLFPRRHTFGAWIFP